MPEGDGKLFTRTAFFFICKGSNNAIQMSNNSLRLRLWSMNYTDATQSEELWSSESKRWLSVCLGLSDALSMMPQDFLRVNKMCWTVPNNRWVNCQTKTCTKQTTLKILSMSSLWHISGTYNWAKLPLKSKTKAVTKVNEFDSSPVCQKDVVSFDVTMDDPVVV